MRVTPFSKQRNTKKSNTIKTTKNTPEKSKNDIKTSIINTALP